MFITPCHYMLTLYICNTAIDSVSRLLPHEYEEYYLRVYCKHKSQVQVLQVAFELWCEAHMHTYGSPAPVTANEVDHTNTVTEGVTQIPVTPTSKRIRL